MTHLQVWQGASQMRNDLKKKAKLIADEAYGLTGMKAQQKQALATWLTTGCRESLKDDVVVNVPNFIFPVVEVVWVDGQRGNKSSYIRKNAFARLRVVKNRNTSQHLWIVFGFI